MRKDPSDLLSAAEHVRLANHLEEQQHRRGRALVVSEPDATVRTGRLDRVTLYFFYRVPPAARIVPYMPSPLGAPLPVIVPTRPSCGRIRPSFTDCCSAVIYHLPPSTLGSGTARRGRARAWRRVALTVRPRGTALV